MKLHRAQARLSALLLSVLLLLSLTACGGGTSGTPASEPQTTEDTQTAEQTPEPSETGDEFQGITEPTDEDRALLAEYVEANSIASTLERHTAKQVRCEYYYGENGEEVVNAFTHYADKDKYVFMQEVANQGFMLQELMELQCAEDEQGEFLVETFRDTEESYREELDRAKNYMSLEIPPEEIMTGIMKLDNLCVITTEITDADWLRPRMEDAKVNAKDGAGYDYEDGMVMCYSYTFDSNTKDLIEIVTSLRLADGTRIPYDHDVVTYDQEFEVDASRFAPYFAADKFCDITIVFSPGTEEEHEMTYLLPAGVYFNAFVDGEPYEGKFYTDAARTEVYEGGDPDARPEELTLYVPAQG